MFTVVVGEKEYNQFLNDGYVVYKEKTANYCAAVGKYVTFRKSLSDYEILAQSVSHAIIFPLACISASISYQGIEDCGRKFVEMSRGFVQEKRFVKDAEATAKLRQQDYEALGIHCLDLQVSLKNYIKKMLKQGDSLAYCPEFKQHRYLSFYGPKSQFSYIILIPHEDVENALLYPVFNQQGLPCNAVEIQEAAKSLGRRYEENAKESIMQSALFRMPNNFDNQSGIRITSFV